MSKETLLLVDGSSYLFRAFHALPDLRNGQGEPTGAIHGVVSMLRRLREDQRLHGGTSLGAVVFDAPGPTFRDAWYPEYKANRSATPDDLRAQIAPIHEITRAMGWPLLVVEGVEADDVIGTLARRARAEGHEVLISTGDKDMAQLVDAGCWLVNTMSRDGTEPERVGPEGVVQKFGVPPERIVDWLTLVGDAVDNVPGVDKVGPKTAVKWLAEHGSLDGVMAAAGSMKGRVGENLRAALEWLPMARRLVTIRCDCDLSAHVSGGTASLQLGAEDTTTLLAHFERWELRTFARQLRARQDGAPDRIAAGSPTPGAVGTQPDLFMTPPAAEPPPVAPAAGGAEAASAAAPLPDAASAQIAAPGRYETVLTEAALSQWLARIQAAPITSFDTETTSLDPMQARIVGLSLAVEAGAACYIPLAHTQPGSPQQLDRTQVLERLRPWIESDTHAKVGQNLKYDTHVLANHGLTLRGITDDTMLQSYVLEAHRTHGMDALAARHLGIETVTYEQVAGKGVGQITFDQVGIEAATRYAAEDADITLRLHHFLRPQVAADARLESIYRDLEMPAAAVLQTMERTGVLIDPGLLSAQSVELAAQIVALEQQAHTIAGEPFNLGSPKQIGEILFGRLGIKPVRKTPKGAPSTDESVLEKLARDHPLARILLDWRSLAKLRSTYTDKLPGMVNPQTGRVHTNYAQAVAVTGRLASTDPNLQNIPVRTAEGRRIREAFIAPPGHCLISADYSQIELRIMAHISGDAGLRAAFAAGLDVHRATAGEIFGVAAEAVNAEQRRAAKAINFGLIYGMSAWGLAEALDIDRETARQYIDRYFTRYPAVATYMEQTRLQARERGYVETVFGRRLWLAEINAPSGPRRAGAERAAINAPMQGTAADLIKRAMIDVHRWLHQEGLQSRLVMQVHDELVLEVPEAEVALLRTELPRLMAGVAELAVPLEAGIGIGANWEQAH